MSERRGPFSGRAVQHGGGVGSTRAFPTDSFPENLDAFVLFERFYIEPDTGFPTHPHRGFEIVSSMLEGGMAHEDSMGVSHTAAEGDAMHITTDAGMEHSELPADNEACNGLQPWVNLPRDQKVAEPDYEDASAEDLPTEELEGATVTTVVGEGSPLSLHAPVEFFDVRVVDVLHVVVEEGHVDLPPPPGFSEQPVSGATSASTLPAAPRLVSAIVPTALPPDNCLQSDTFAHRTA
jgi:hypothetical protein